LGEAVEHGIGLPEEAFPAGALGVDARPVLGDQVVLRLLPVDGVEVQHVLAVETAERPLDEGLPVRCAGHESSTYAAGTRWFKASAAGPGPWPPWPTRSCGTTRSVRRALPA